MMTNLPEAALLRVNDYLTLADRLKLQLCSKAFSRIFNKCDDITALEIRPGQRNNDEPPSTTSLKLRLLRDSRHIRVTYQIRVTNRTGMTCHLKSCSVKSANRVLKLLLQRLISLNELTIWDACLGNDFDAVLARIKTINTLRFWNCSLYFDKKRPKRRLLESLFSLPQLGTVLILDSTTSHHSNVKPNISLVFPHFLAKMVSNQLANLQITNIYVSWRTLDLLCNKLSHSLKRLAIGGTFGKASKKKRYLNSLSKLQVIEDLDIPPHIFHLGDTANVDAAITDLLGKLPLTSLGFRHYNSAMLFRYVQFQLPEQIRVLRIHHNANRLPNFEQLGVPQLETYERPPLRKTSWLSARRGSLSSKNSVLSSSEHGFDAVGVGCTTCTRAGGEGVVSIESDSMASTSSISMSSQNNATSTDTTAQPETSLHARNLTIFAIEEATRTMHESVSKLRRRIHSGVQVFYLHESIDTQEMLGRMAAPIRSPHVYTRSTKREICVIKGDLVRPIPLTSLGMESDYEMSDREAD